MCLRDVCFGPVKVGKQPKTKMVNTRHRSEAQTDRSYLQLDDYKKIKPVADGDESDDSSGVVHFSPRSQQRRGKSTRTSTRQTRRRFVIDDDQSEEDTDIETEVKTVERQLPKRRMLPSSSNAGVRRSSRQRKLLYGTFDPKILDRALYVDKQNYDENPRKKRRIEDNNEHEEDAEEDMYSRVKRVRKQVKRDMYGMPVQESSDSDSSDDDDDEEEDDDDDDEGDDDGEEEEEDDDHEEDKESDKPTKRSYFLREHKPRTQLFEVPIVERRRRKPAIFAETPQSPVRRRKRSEVYRSPAHRRVNLRRKAAFHGSSSTSSASSGSSSDEEHFQKRKARSMARARNQLLPMNLQEKDMTGTLKDRQRIGSSLADVDPMTIDRTVTFESVGGLGKHVRALKEMVVFPLLYSEVFERFKITPPRGVLFYGPPGTGKTLVARALANECSTGEKRVAFFMRKGADCLSKWVGESERQLRLLFDQAYQMRPSIIFFDEIDGLAPVRSSRQDQIHSSIVSTLLALMDGLDNRGEIVVIGATNRIDSIDPALRRPGRFDREFLFPLPSKEARRQILSIHTKDWNPKLSTQFVNDVADLCVGYCGADLKSLCTEAALLALRRRYPQIYQSSEKLQLDVSSISMCAKDFHQAMRSIVPASHRCVASPARALSCQILPLLQQALSTALDALGKVFPASLCQSSNQDLKDGEMEDCSDDEEEISIYEGKRRKRSCDLDFRNALKSFSIKSCFVHRPRLILAGEGGCGQTSHLGPAILHQMEQLPVHVLDLSSLFAVSTKSPEEACSQVFREAMRTCPSTVYMPRVDQWWDVLPDSLKTTFLTTLQNLEPSAPILVLATSEVPYTRLDPQLYGVFGLHSGEVVHVQNPTMEQRREYFSDLLLNQTVKEKKVKKASARKLEVLPKAPPPVPRKLTDRELKILRDREENTLRELRIFLREVLNRVVKDRKFFIFARPVDIEEVPDYYEVIEKPMDLSTMMSKIDMHEYQTAQEFIEDVDLICSNALEYNPIKDTAGRAIRHRACALRDTFHAVIKAELDPEFEKQCEDIKESRKNRGEARSSTVPNFYFTKPLPGNQERYSRRVRGMDIEPQPDLEVIEKQWSEEKRSRSPNKNESSPKTTSRTTEKCPDVSRENNESTPDMKHVSPCVYKRPFSKISSLSVSPKKTKKKEVWSYKKRRRFNRVGRFSLPTFRRQHHSDFVIKKKSHADIEKTETLHVDVVDVCNKLESSHKSPKSPKSPMHSTLSPRQELSPRRLNQTNLLAEVNVTEDSMKEPCVKAAVPKHVMDVDSGISSSVDSNGDSVDSIEQAKQLAAQKMLTSEDTESQSQTVGGPAVVMDDITVDRERLEALLETVVNRTENCNIENLQKLYSMFSHCIQLHHENNNKALLVQELECISEKFYKPH